MIKNIAGLLIIVLCAGIVSCQGLKKEKTSGFYDQALEESLIPVRPGVPGKSPFWNGYAQRFIYVPSFDIKAVDGAHSYRFTATSAANFKDYVFDADVPWALLTPIWKDLPVGQVVLRVEGLDKNGHVIADAGAREFYRAAVFNGPYQKPVVNYQESARLGLKDIFEMKHVQYWAIKGKPDPDYDLYCYPSKIIGAVVKAMLMLAELSPEDSDQAMFIARNAADYLIKTSEPAGAPIEFFPQTYAGDALTANAFKNQIMIAYGAEAAEAFLDLYDVTQEACYFDAAKRIAHTFSKLQLDSGTWYLKLFAKTGKPVTENLCIPMRIIQFFDRLMNQYQLTEYKDLRDRAFDWVMTNPVKTFNWEGQFEDVEPSNPYVNLTKHQAASLAIYLFEHATENSAYIELAEELVRFSENLFVIWERPFSSFSLEKSQSDLWMTPCVLEQYRCYLPVDASSAKLIATFQAAFTGTGKELYLAKAVALANNMTRVQNFFNGRYTTWWKYDNKGWKEDWINCAVYDAQVMMGLGKSLQKIHAEYKTSQKPMALLLSQSSDEILLAELINRYHKSTDSNIKSELLRAIAIRDAQKAKPIIEQALMSDETVVRAMAMSLLEQVDLLQKEDILFKAVNDNDERIRKVALHVLGQLADEYNNTDKVKASEFYTIVLKNDADVFDQKQAINGLNNRLSENIRAKMKERGRNIRNIAQKVGFISNWWIAGPFPNAGDVAEKTAWFPENKIDFNQKQTFSGNIAKWQTFILANMNGIVDLAGLFGQNYEAVYAYSEVDCPEDKPVLFKIGSNDGVVCWLNGQKIHENFTGRILTVDEDVVHARLKKGKNRILLKILNRGGNWQFCMRMTNLNSIPLDIGKYGSVLMDSH